MQKNNLLHSLPYFVGLAFLLRLSVAAAAETGIDNVTIGQLEVAQARNLLLEQQVQTARLQQQLRQTQTGENISAGMTSPVTSAPSVNPAAGFPADTTVITGQSDRVRLMEIYGRSGELRARISLPRGGTTEIHRGDLIPGTKQTVTAVTPDVVRLSDGSELTF